MVLQNKKQVTLKEYEQIDEELSSKEFDILSDQYKNQIDLIELGNDKYRIKASQYVGIIVLPNHIIIINPKIQYVNFAYMLSYVHKLDPFRAEDFQYLKEKEETIFEYLAENFLTRVEKLCKRGISKNYYEDEENLPIVRGKVLVRQNILHNTLLKHRVFCSFSDFGSDNMENRLIKYTLYYLSKMKLQVKGLSRRARHLLHYFESVTLDFHFFTDALPRITYNRLLKHYQPLINLCRLLITHCSVKLDSVGDVIFSSFLVDMNDLFQKFVARILTTDMKDKALRIKEQEIEYADEQSMTQIRPDIVIWRGSTSRILVMDAKYKEEVNDDDLRQIWIYCIVLSVPAGILVYPKHAALLSEKRTLRGHNVHALLKAIDLSKPTLAEFKDECNRFANEVESIIQKELIG